MIIFKGSMGKKQLTTTQERLDNISEEKSCIILTTGCHPGKGFDHSHLDMFFLALPVSWKC